MFGIFNKKKEETIEKIQTELNEQIIEIPKEKKEKKQDFNTSQFINIGEDVKNEVEVFSRSFFKSKNAEKAKAYASLQHFLATFDIQEKNSVQNMTYLEFKEKEEKVLNKIKIGFSQYLSKGSHLDEDMRRSIDLVFSDVKKLPSRGHRYWYYKIYIWQDINKD